MTTRSVSTSAAGGRTGTESERAVIAPAAWSERPPRLLIYRIGYLGDSVVTLPSLWAIRAAYPGARLTLLAVGDPDGGRVLPHRVWPAEGLVDDYVYYPTAERSLPRRGWGMLRAAWRLRRQSFDGVIYLAPSLRPPAAVARDVRLFRLLGLRTIIGAEPERARRSPRGGAHPLARMPSEAELLMGRLCRAGIPVPPDGQGRSDLGLTAAEHAEAQSWLRSHGLGPEQDGHLFALGPAAAMPAKLWPVDRHIEVARALRERYRLTPIVVCGPSDAALARRVIGESGGGAATLDGLSIRALGALLSRCRLYVGNDTGVMHLAAAAGIRCVVVMAAVDQPGVWEPAGHGHRCFRVALPCEGCLESVCPYANRCLEEITAGEVIAACEEALAG